MLNQESRAGKRARRRRHGLSGPAYMALRIGMWAVAALLLVVFANKVWHPIGLKRSLRRDIAVTQREVVAAKRDNDAQKRRIKYLNTREGAQAQARKLGYINPGEVPLRVQEPPPAPPVPPSTN